MEIRNVKAVIENSVLNSFINRVWDKVSNRVRDIARCNVSNSILYRVNRRFRISIRNNIKQIIEKRNGNKKRLG